jgi:apolipoprotein N-acyltransferase
MNFFVRLGPWIVAAVGGGLWAACFGVEPWTVAPWIALVPLFLALSTAHRARRAFLLGWLHGTLFWLVSIPWIAPTLVTFGEMAEWLAWLLLLALALYLGVYTGVFSALGLRVWRRACEGRGALAVAAALFGLPGLWVALEWLRGWLFSGFPWNLAGYAWTGVPGALPVAAWIGAWGVGFLAVLVNAAIAFGLVRRVGREQDAVLDLGPDPGRGGDWRPGLGAVLSVLLLLAVAARYAVPPDLSAEARAGSPAGPTAAAGTPVRIVQPAIYNQVAYDPETTRESYTRLFRRTEEACDRPGALVIWPESAAWPFELGRDGLLARDVESFVKSSGCALVLNSTHRVDETSETSETSETGETYYNSAFLVTPSGERVRYDKRHLVPFGEYVPLAGVFSFMDVMARNAGAYSAADEVTLLPLEGESGGDRLGMAICFEVTFPTEVADLVRAGATSLVTLTNDAWYGDTWAPWQHFTAARWRAAETRRPLLRAAITGVSGVIGPDGSVEDMLGVGEEGVLSARVDGREDLSPFARAPLLVPVLSLVLALAALAYARLSPDNIASPAKERTS